MNITILEKKFNTREKCVKYLEKLRWNNIPECPYCGSIESINIEHNFRHHCKNCSRSYSVLIGTIFEDTRLPLPTFFKVISLMLNNRTGISASEMSRQVGIGLPTAWFVLMKIRCAMVETITDLSGLVEADEAYLGGSPRPRNIRRPKNDSVAYLAHAETETEQLTPEKKNKRGRGTKKVPVAGIVERYGRIVTEVVGKLNSVEMMRMLKEYVKKGWNRTTVITDENRIYNDTYRHHLKHKTIKHKEAFVKGKNHTNTIDGFWGRLKSGIEGNYRVLSRKYLPFYLAEWGYKYNRRNDNELQFEAFMKDAMSSGKCFVHYKPEGEPLKMVHPRKPKPEKAFIKEFHKANKDAGKKKEVKKKLKKRKIRKTFKAKTKIKHKSKKSRKGKHNGKSKKRK